MFEGVIQTVWQWLRGVLPKRSRTQKSKPKRRAIFIEGDELPADLHPFDLMVAREDGVLWSAGMMCPCGCGRRIEVMLLDGVKPRWDLTVDEQDIPTLKPSVWVANGCRSHFWLRDGAIVWTPTQTN